MRDKSKIRVPFILDIPIVGRTISPFPLGVFDEYIIIETGNLTYKHSNLPTKSDISYLLKDLKNIVVKTKQVSNFKKLSPWIHMADMAPK